MTFCSFSQIRSSLRRPLSLLLSGAPRNGLAVIINGLSSMLMVIEPIWLLGRIHDTHTSDYGRRCQSMRRTEILLPNLKAHEMSLLLAVAPYICLLRKGLQAIASIPMGGRVCVRYVCAWIEEQRSERTSEEEAAGRRPRRARGAESKRGQFHQRLVLYETLSLCNFNANSVIQYSPLCT